MPRGFALPAGTQYPCAAVRYSVRRFFIEIYLPACLEKSKWGQTVGVAELPTMQRLFSFFFLKNGPRLLYRGGGRFFCAAQGPPGPPHAAPVLAGHKAQRRAFPSPAPKRIPALWGRKGEPGTAPARTNMETATCPSKSRAVVCSSETDALRRAHGTDGTQRSTSCKKGKQPRRGEPQRRPPLPGIGGNSTAKREVSPCGRGHGKGRGFAPPAAPTRLLTAARRSYFFSPLPARLRATAATPQPMPPTE